MLCLLFLLSRIALEIWRLMWRMEKKEANSCIQLQISSYSDVIIQSQCDSALATMTTVKLLKNTLTEKSVKTKKKQSNFLAKQFDFGIAVDC